MELGMESGGAVRPVSPATPGPAFNKASLTRSGKTIVPFPGAGREAALHDQDGVDGRREGTVMSDLNRDDLKIILLFGIHLAKIDGDFAVWEKKILARFADAMKLTEREKSEMVHQEISLSQGLRRLSGQGAKSLLVKTLCAVSHSDGDTHPNEVDFIHKVVERLETQVFILPQGEWGTYEDEVITELNEAASPLT
jgi:tellurite resistance protein